MPKQQRHSQAKSFDRPRRGAPSKDLRERQKPPTTVLLYGHHPVQEALKNPNRRAKILWLDQNKQEDLSRQFAPILDQHPNPPAIQWTSRDFIAQSAQGESPQPVPHQGVMLRCAPLDNINEASLAALPFGALILALDHVNDPHNVGAIIRTCAAFGVSALLTTDRHTPYESGLLAKTASGGMDRMPWCRVRNLGDSLCALQTKGFHLIGLDGNTQMELGALPDLVDERVILVLGAEGKGLRERTLSLLDHRIRLPTVPDFPHLNVSNAAAIALYDLRGRLKK